MNSEKIKSHWFSTREERLKWLDDHHQLWRYGSPDRISLRMLIDIMVKEGLYSKNTGPRDIQLSIERDLEYLR